jgi:1-acyl-sn-glycerol-3-phosphate acyltransferase
MVQAAPSRQEATEDAVIAVVRELALELHPEPRQRLSVGLDSHLERDLGIDSIGRAELVHRLDQAFKVRLPDELIGDAETPRDLTEAVLSARPRPPNRAKRAAGRPAAKLEAPEPIDARTLIEALSAHRAAHPDARHVVLWREDGEGDVISYGDLDRAARAVGGGLMARGLRQGDRVAIMLPTEAAFFFAYFGTLYAGGIPVPIYPPYRPAQLEEHIRRQAGILRNAEARFLITSAEISRVGRLLHGLVEPLSDIALASELERADPLAEPVPARPDGTALIQYTSGSTGDPKGVVLSHANILANIRAMGTVLEASSVDTFVSWLPLYHDMGLIGAWLGSLYYGAKAVIMPPFAFLADPARWLWAIHRHHGTLSAAPNFAFELCLKAVKDDALEGLNLGSLRSVVNGAEPVSPVTIARFTERFKRYGFRREALAPVYGLAECSVGLAFPPLGRAPIVDRVERERLARTGAALPVSSEQQAAIEFVACGQPLPGHQIRIVDSGGRELPERREGRLQFRGPSATSGYFNDEAKTRALFDGEWLESGDRAYVAGGDIFITGRTKDIIIRAGRNIYPHELEELVGTIEGVRKGCVAVFAARDERLGTERLVVLAETRVSDEKERERLQQRIAEASLPLLDMPPDEIVLVPPRTVPKTSSGKIRRAQARQLYDSGDLLRTSRALPWQILRLWMSGLLQRGRSGLRAAGELAYAAWWWGVLALMAGPVWLSVILLPERRWRHAAVSGAARLFLRITGLPLTVAGEAAIPGQRAIFVANHSSYLDGLVLSVVLPGPLSFTAKEELARQWIAGPFLRRLGTLFVRRTDPRGGIEDTAATAEAVRAGERIVSFPEGTLTRMPGLLGFHMGAFLAAVQARAPVVPVAIRGTRSVLRGGQWFPRRGAIHVHIGRPLFPDGEDFDAALRLRNAARAAILGQCGEPDLAREQVSL